jgi:hypothetical protein
MVLLDRLARYDGEVHRNILSLRASRDLFADLAPDAGARAAAMAADMRIAQHVPPSQVERALLYSTAIDYPFTADTSVASRFGDGTVRVWYGALDEQTARAETCWHQLRQVMAIEGVDRVVVRHRAVYRVQAQGHFVDLRGKEQAFPQIVADDYAFTQGIGRTLSVQGMPGLLYPSARWPGGECLAAFRSEPLGNPVLSHYLTYRIDPVARHVVVEREPGVALETLALEQLTRRRAA